MKPKMALDRFNYSKAGYLKILKSPEVRAALQRRADKVKAAAEAALPAEAGDAEIFADTTIGRTRAGATVLGVPLRIEQDRRPLGQAMSAAR